MNALHRVQGRKGNEGGSRRGGAMEIQINLHEIHIRIALLIKK